MHILVLDITSPSGNYHKSLPISEQAASDPSRRGNLIREAVAQYPGGKATGWKVVDGDRIIAQSSMKGALVQAVPGVADSQHEIALTQGDADYVSALTGAPLQEVDEDPFDLSPKAEAEVADIVADKMAERLDAEVARQARIAAITDAREHGRSDAKEALTGLPTVRSVITAYGTPYGDGGDGGDPYLRDAYAAGFTEVANDFKPIVWKTPEDQSNFNGKGGSGDLTIIETEYHAERLSKEYGVDFWVVSHGQNRRPRNHLMRAMKVGEWVSEAFNGDYYPLGRIKAMGGQGNALLGYRIITVETADGGEVRFWRRKQSDVWKKDGADGTFGLVGGLYNARNPSF